MGTCIWCRRSTGQEPVEHIIPDSLRCPPDMVLRDGEVCAKCNNRLSRLDQALVSEFELARFIAGVPNKNGHPPSISTRPNAGGGSVDGKPHLDVNMEPHSVETTYGRRIGGRTGRVEDLHMKMEHCGLFGKGTVSQGGICNSKRAVRAIHKVAFEAFAKHHGVKRALRPDFDAVRRFVERGTGERTVILIPAVDGVEYQNQVLRNEGDVFNPCVQAFRIAFMRFFVDLSPDERHLPEIKQKCKEHLGDKWTWAPL